MENKDNKINRLIAYSVIGVSLFILSLTVFAVALKRF